MRELRQGGKGAKRKGTMTLVMVVVLIVPVSLCGGIRPGKRRKPPGNPGWKLPLESVAGLLIVELPTSQGKLRMVVDTGSNATTLSEVNEASLIIHLDRLDVHVHVYPTSTVVLADFNRSVESAKRVQGILGSDFFSQFDLFALDYQNNRLTLSRRAREQTGATSFGELGTQ